MKWIDKTATFENREWKDKYLEICEVLDDKIEVNLYSCDDINNYEIYVSYGIMYGIVYAHKNKAEKLREEIKDLIYNDYITMDIMKICQVTNLLVNFIKNIIYKFQMIYFSMKMIYE